VLLHLLYVVALVVGINVLPALAPPTWTVLVFFRYRYPELPIAALIVGGAVGAATGRFVLARAFRVFGRKLPRRRQESLQALGRTITESRTGLVASFALFAVSPLPSAQLFEAAGLARASLGRLVGAFFVGRLASYSIYLTAASAAHRSLNRIFAKGLFSPQALLTEALSIALLVATILIDWPTVIDKVRKRWAARHA